MRSRIVKLSETYRGVCDEPVGNHRFRVRAEVLLSGEEYYTIEFGCVIENLVQVPWGEYSSADLEIKFGAQVERAKHLKTMVRRSSDRLGRKISFQEALRLEGSDIGKNLLLSNKDYSNLSREARDSIKESQAVVNPPAAQNRGSEGSKSLPYYEARAAEAKLQMQKEASKPPSPTKRWSDSPDSSGGEEEEDNPSLVSKETSGAVHRTVPVPHPGKTTRVVPAPSSAGVGGSRNIPAPSTRG
jgi:hypothetical protein